MLRGLETLKRFVGSINYSDMTSPQEIKLVKVIAKIFRGLNGKSVESGNVYQVRSVIRRCLTMMTILVWTLPGKYLFILSHN